MNAQQVEKLLQGNQAFAHLSFSMLLMRQKMLYANDPSPSALESCVNEINVFMEKFKSAMGPDFALISKL
jgi:hypothetical protein